MGLATSISAAHEVRGTPKIAILSPTLAAISHSSNSALKHPADVSITAYTMGKPHPSFQLTGAVCLSSAVAVPGTIAHDLAKKREVLTPPETPPSCSVDGDGDGDGDEKVGNGRVVKRVVTIAHPSGELSTLVEMWEGMDEEVEVRSVSVSRTARRIFEGNVLFAL